MSSDRTQILKMLADGKISVDEAERLLSAVGENSKAGDDFSESAVQRKGSPKFLRVVVNSHQNEEGRPEKVNVRVPIALMRAGIKLSSLIPDNAFSKVDHALREKGINFDFKNIKPENIEELIEALIDFTVDVESENEQVKVFCE